MKRTYVVKARWDEDAGVFYSESDIDGLHIEAPTLDAFEAVMVDTAVELIVANHMSTDDLEGRPLRDLIPAIVWERPADIKSAA